MANTAKQLGQGGITASVTTLYTVPGSTTTDVKSFLFCNTTSAPITVRVFLVPSGGSPSAANAIVYDRSLAPGETWPLVNEQVLSAGGTIQMQVSATGCTVTCSGLEIA